MNKATKLDSDLAVSKRKNKRLMEAFEEQQQLLATLMKAQTLVDGSASVSKLKERIDKVAKQIEFTNSPAEGDQSQRAVKFSPSEGTVDKSNAESKESTSSYADAAKAPAQPDAFKTPSPSYRSCLKKSSDHKKSSKSKKASKKESKKEKSNRHDKKQEKKRRKGEKSKSSNSRRDRSDDSSGRAGGAPRVP